MIRHVAAPKYLIQSCQYVRVAKIRNLQVINSLKTERSHNANFVFNGGTEDCPVPPMTTNWQNVNSWFSVYIYIHIYIYIYIYNIIYIYIA